MQKILPDFDVCTTCWQQENINRAFRQLTGTRCEAQSIRAEWNSRDAAVTIIVEFLCPALFSSACSSLLRSINTVPTTCPFLLQHMEAFNKRG